MGDVTADLLKRLGVKTQPGTQDVDARAKARA
jgi:hypothetical protein